MAKKKIRSFYEYMMHYPYKDNCRRALAADLKKLSALYPQLKEINSMMDLMLAVSVLTDPRAVEAATPSLWCEYCTVNGIPIT